MATQTDLIVPLSALQFDGDDCAQAEADAWETVQVGALLQNVIERHASAQLSEGQLFAVSVTFDVSADAAAGEQITFKSKIDRRTRTLVFVSGLAIQNSKPLLKATMVYRIG